MKLRKLFVLAALIPMVLTGCNNKPKKLKSITLTAESAKTESGFDVVLDAGATQVLKYTYDPAELKPTFTWAVGDEKVATLVGREGGGTVTAKAAGETEVYVTADGVESNHLKIKVVESGKTNEDFPKARTTYEKGGVEKPLNMQTIYTNNNAPHLDSLSEAHVMVVPFGFTDDNLQEVQNEETIETIRKTFFGTREEMKAVGAWYSMAEFYQTSSYGLSDFQGKVLPTWCIYNGTSTEFGLNNQGIKAAEYARTWYKAEYDKDNHGALGADAEPITYFDANNDGFLDLVWIVYSHPTDHSNQNWWAYVTYTGNSKNVSYPTVKTLGWASIDWMSNGFNGYDPHTFIHETGHTYGLDDYYDYNKRWAPMGGVDFMDHNLGDQCMFSKFTLGWTAPWVVDDDAIITLRPGTTTGDCFIIPSPGYNGTAFDEYMMVELMAPVGLAEQDYKNGYQGTAGFSEPGLRITHVDARVYKGNHDTYLTDNPEEGIDFRVCNTQGGRSGIKYDGDYWQIPDPSDSTKIIKSYYALTTVIESVINPSDNVLTRSTYNVSNSSLYKEGQRFDLKPAKSGGHSWASVFMPSQSNLWNKAKTTTGWTGNEQKPQEVDENCTFNYSLKVLSIQEDAQYGYVAKVKVTANAY